VSAEYRQRVCMHEAGHFLVAYLMGVLPKGYTLSAVDALRRYGALNIQAGTVFCDRVFQSEVRKSLSLPGGVPHGRAAQGLHAAACSRARCANLFHFLVAYLMGVLPKGYTLPRVPERGAQISFTSWWRTSWACCPRATRCRVFQSEVRKSLSPLVRFANRRPVVSCAGAE
jgi:hypothetical protein